MDYVDWVERVLLGVKSAWDLADEHNKNIVGISVAKVAVAVFPGLEEGNVSAGAFPQDVYHALNELEALGLVERQLNRNFFKLTQTGRKVLRTGMNVLWEPMVGEYLEEDQITVLTKLSEMCQEVHETHVSLSEVSLVKLGEALGTVWAGGRGREAYYVVKQLEDMGLAMLVGGMGALTAIPTYRGIVRATRTADTEMQALIRELVAEWETTNVEFKQQVNLDWKSDKAEFVKDVLALGTTKSSGRRFMVIGFDEGTHGFVKSVDPGITQNRLENILDENTTPVLCVKYNAVSWVGGTVGLIEVLREPYKLPYRVKKDMRTKDDGKNIAVLEGDVFVRRGSRTWKLVRIDVEYLDLEAEGERARQS